MGKIKKVLISSFLLVSCIVVERLMSIRLPFISIGFKFIPFMFSAMLLGTKYATVIGVTSDIIGRLMFPMSYFFPGFTLSAGITGYLYGKFLYTDGKIEANKKFLTRLILCVIIVTLVVNVGLNTLWITYITDKASRVILPIRFLKQIIMVPVEIMVMYILTDRMQSSINMYTNKVHSSINGYKGIMNNDLFEKC
ncbi:MAG: folate family ECF transporter S component [Clostridiales bacterium]|nr:folate family ECF transporter S component [Clostridiales bacterium]